MLLFSNNSLLLAQLVYFALVQDETPQLSQPSEGDWLQALGVLAHAAKSFVEANVFTYTAGISSYQKASRWHVAIQCLDCTGLGGKATYIYLNGPGILKNQPVLVYIIVLCVWSRPYNLVISCEM